jgi:type IV pilus assembly protein PilC
MPLFSYRALREDGVTLAEDAVAGDAEELRQMLAARGYLVVDLRQKKSGLGAKGGSTKDFLIFNQELTTLIKAGLPILQALELLERRTEKAGFRSVLQGIIHEIKGGAALSDAMALHPAWFSPLYSATVRAGEQSGALVEVLQRFTVYQKKVLAVRRKVISALAYPAFLVIALVAVLSLFFLYIIPNFIQMYGDQAGSLPYMTTLLVSFTRALTRYAPFLFFAAIAAGVGISLWRKTDKGKRALDGLKLRIPLVRTLLLQYLLSQLTRTLAAVLRGGIPLVQALDTTAGVIANKVIARKLAEVRQLVTGGVSLSLAFEQTRLAPDMTVRMIEVGESSGDLPQMLEDVAEFYDQEVENRLGVLTTMIEPVLMLSMGIIIAAIVVALYLPIFEMGSRIK